MTEGAPSADRQKKKPTEKTHPHSWVGAATVALDDKTAKHADLRGSYRTSVEERVDVLDVYCGGKNGCRRPYEEVAGQPCVGKLNNAHLIGGTPGERKKRKGPVENLAAPPPASRRLS